MTKTIEHRISEEKAWSFRLDSTSSKTTISKRAVITLRHPIKRTCWLVTSGTEHRFHRLKACATSKDGIGGTSVATTSSRPPRRANAFAPLFFSSSRLDSSTPPLRIRWPGTRADPERIRACYIIVPDSTTRSRSRSPGSVTLTPSPPVKPV